VERRRRLERRLVEEGRGVRGARRGAGWRLEAGGGGTRCERGRQELAGGWRLVEEGRGVRGEGKSWLEAGGWWRRDAV
jgi:hypothetical protein